jgi:hypothetical protein
MSALSKILFSHQLVQSSIFALQKGYRASAPVPVLREPTKGKLSTSHRHCVQNGLASNETESSHTDHPEFHAPGRGARSRVVRFSAGDGGRALSSYE